MNWIKLNGLKSTDRKGLLISALPPITKPLMRTNIEEIDGRDGDIVTKLGYAAYNKEISIGLYGDYDVDEIIKYFDTQGTVIFSNEPDKYYRYQIIEQIDFERLLRFKTAKVKFHVQPFKYSAVDEVMEVSPQKDENFYIFNRGNAIAKPIYTFYGRGPFSIILNNHVVLGVTLSSDADDYITIDVEKLNAYKENTLKNRSTDGDYSKLALNVGRNTMYWTGALATITKIEVKNYSRWL